MSIRVTNGKVWDGIKMYLPGDVIHQLSADDEDSLVDSGKAEYEFAREDDEEDNIPPIKETGNDDDIPPAKDEEVPPPKDGIPEEVHESDGGATESVENLNINFNADEYLNAANSPEIPKKNRK